MTRRANSSSAPRWRGRSVIAAGLVVFVLVAAVVIWRRSYGVMQGAEMRSLDRQRMQLEAQKAALEREVRDAAGRARLGPVAETRLDMHVPADSEVIVLPATRATRVPSGEGAADRAAP
jgi:cell division protein FtsL